MSRQKGISELDQRARMLTLLLKGDSTREPFGMLCRSRPTPAVPARQCVGNARPRSARGYFSYSENDINNDTDDVLQFTIDRPSSTTALGTHSAPLGASANVSKSQSEPTEFDDAITGKWNRTSTLGEVSWFLRNGSLYAGSC